MTKEKVLLKMSGEILQQNGALETKYINPIIDQIKELRQTHLFGIVIGGGNFFRGKNGIKLGIDPNTSDQIGMLLTLVNGLILQDLFSKKNLRTQIFSALSCSPIGSTISPQNLSKSLKENDCLIFVGGLGSPGFTTDTAAIIRARQIEASIVWKLTKVDGVYDDDPKINPAAKKFDHLTFQEALEKGLNIVDSTTFTLAKQNNINLKVFSFEEENSLLKAAKDQKFGTLVSS